MHLLKDKNAMCKPGWLWPAAWLRRLRTHPTMLTLLLNRVRIRRAALATMQRPARRLVLLLPLLLRPSPLLTLRRALPLLLCMMADASPLANVLRLVWLTGPLPRAPRLLWFGPVLSAVLSLGTRLGARGIAVERKLATLPWRFRSVVRCRRH